MRRIIDSILICTCVILLTIVSANSQQTTKTPDNKASKEPGPVIICAEKNGLTNEEIGRILFRHNEARAKVNASDLVWDCKLAATAQEWATRGIAEHRSDNFLGENISVSSHAKAKATQGVKQWLHEKKRIDPATKKCKPGKMCLHYTQVVSATSERIGCGINRAATGKWKLLMVCNYDPAGNMGVGTLIEPLKPVLIAAR
ncbi:MAG: hypothetical protein DMF63_05270 [Acidobacteria bacterium]|nr:MAG: hypothetical protein DMF63_05270 [Acidobacteriota bacterium]